MDTPFKVRADRQAARVIDLLRQVSEPRSKGTLTELPSIGAGLAARIEELLTHGTCRDHERLGVWGTSTCSARHVGVPDPSS